MTNESKALIGLYYGMTACKKNRFGKPQRPVQYVFTKVVIYSVLIGANYTSCIEINDLANSEC